MSKVIGPFRHAGTLGTFSGGRFSASRDTRDAVRPRPARKIPRKEHLDEAALARGIKAGVEEGFARATAKLSAPVLDAAPADRPAESADAFRTRLAAAADAYRLRRARV